jgi:hypothetical protein
MRIRCIVLLILGAIAVPRPAAAWGFEVHKEIMDRAIPLLPAEIRPFFERYRSAIVEHAIDPDLWRTVGWEAEPPRHFLDMDAYGPYPFARLPRSYDDAVARYGREFVEKNGLLPWRTAEIYGKLVEAFRQETPYSRENIKFFASVLTHYESDAHVPFHAAVNYDGQLTGQRGIHARFESELFDRNRYALRIEPAPAKAVGPVRDFVFDTLLESFPLVQPVLDADRAAAAGREYYDDGYFTVFFSRVRPILERRLSESITHAASLITAAWNEAGRPALPLEAPRTPRSIRR